MLTSKALAAVIVILPSASALKRFSLAPPPSSSRSPVFTERPVAFALSASTKPSASAPAERAVPSGPIVMFELTLNASVTSNAQASIRSPAFTGKLTTVVVFPAAVVKSPGVRIISSVYPEVPASFIVYLAIMLYFRS